MKSMSRLFFLLGAVLMAIGTITCYAQSVNSSVQGTVADATGAVVPGADVDLTSTLTGISIG